MLDDEKQRINFIQIAQEALEKLPSDILELATKGYKKWLKSVIELDKEELLEAVNRNVQKWDLCKVPTTEI